MNTISTAQRGLVEQTFHAGGSIRSAMRIAGVAKRTAATIYKQLGERPACGCGQPSDHRGWCRIRFGESGARQEVVKGFQNGKKAGEVPMQSNPMIDNSPKAPKVFMQHGAWIVPPEDRPKGWESMGLREPAVLLHELPNALREVSEVEEQDEEPSLLAVLLNESAGELSENIGQLESATSKEILEVQISAQPLQSGPLKWSVIRPIVAPLKVGESVTVPVPAGITAARLQNNLSSILRAWKETQKFKWTVGKLDESQLRVTKTGEHRSLLAETEDLLIQNAVVKVEPSHTEAVVRPVADAPVPAALPVVVAPPVVTSLEDAKSDICAMMAAIDDKIQKLATLRKLMEDPFIASLLERVR